jgi:hypothetical protein
MLERFKTQEDDGGVATRRRGAVAADHEGTERATTEGTERTTTAATPEMRHARMREEYGGINWGAAFFGWLVAVGLAVILVAVASAAGAAFGLSKADVQGSNVGTIGIVGGAILLAILIVAYYSGGYVAGRMSRFDGARQGLGVWALGLLITVLAAAAGAILGSEYNIFNGLNLPNIPIDRGSLTTGGIIALAAVLLGTILAAVAGGKAGMRYHRRVDRVGYELD